MARTKIRQAPDAVRAEWLRRVEAEYRSAAVTQHLTLWLIQIGASPDLVRAGMRIAGDELTHAELSHRTFLAAGGSGGPALDRTALALPRNVDEPLEHDVTRVAVQSFCLGETVAVPLFKELRAGCTQPVARRALDRILRDEVRHRDFGWTLLTWLFEQPCASELRKMVEAELPTYFRRLRDVYAPPSRGDERSTSDEERAWGLMPLACYRSAIEKALARDWVPRFGKLGVDAKRAWTP